jgi:thioredoxin 1
MKLGHGSILALLLAGWLGLTPVLPALAQGAAAGKALPVVLEFDRKYCPVCHASELAIQAVKHEYPGQFAVRKLYIDEEEYLFHRYKVVIVPTQVFLNASGQEVYRHEGVFKPAELVRKLHELKFID